MSLKSILHDVGHAITSVWHKIVPSIQTDLIIAENAIQVLKTGVDLDSSNVIGSLAGPGGAAVEGKLRSILPSIVFDLQLAEGVIVPDNLDQTLINISQKVKFAKDIDWDNFWHGLSTKVGDAMIDGQLSFGELVHVMQYIHDNKPTVAAPSAPVTTP